MAGSVICALLIAVFLAGCAPSPRSSSPPVSQGPAATIRVSGSGGALPLAQRLAEAFRQYHPEVTFEFVGGTNSGGAIRGVADGVLDLAVVNRQLIDAEMAQSLNYHALARDAVVFAVRDPSSITGITTDQVRQIYGGVVSDWEQIGGQPGPILALDRDEDESMRKQILLRILGESEVRAPVIVLTSARDMAQALERTPSSFGYTTLGLLEIQRPTGVRPLALDGVRPTPESIADGSYPWFMTFGFTQRPDAAEAVRQFVEFASGSASDQVRNTARVAAPLG